MNEINSLKIKSYVKFILLISITYGIYSEKKKSAQDNYDNKKRQTENMNQKTNSSQTKYFYNFSFLKNEMDSYGLYNIFKIPQISFILMENESYFLNFNQTIEQFKYINFKNFNDIEIILYFKNESNRDFIIFKKQYQKFIDDKIIKIYDKKGNVIEDFYNIINLISGKYSVFTKNLNIIKNLQMEKIIELTKGKIDIYYNFNISNETHIYLIKTKALKDIIDNGIKINSLHMIINHIISIDIPQPNYIHISLCPNDYYTNLAYVAISSILSSKAINTFICFYIIIPNNFKKKNINFLNSLYETYDYFNITFIKMDNRYNTAFSDKYITKQAYYRFSLGELLPHLNKIIYIDTDIIVYKDLLNFYNLNFNGKMILAHPTIGNRKTLKLGYLKINSGILLLNLYEMRKYKLEKKVIEITKKVKKLRYHDQSILNDYLNLFLGILPPEFHARPWSNYKEIDIMNNEIGNIFDKDYYYFSQKYPTIRHFLGNYKPKHLNINYIEDWWYFARKSKYYNNKSSSFISAFSF